MTPSDTGRSAWPDLIHPDTFADGVPHELFADMRKQAPVVWVDEPAKGIFAGGPGFWAVLRHADVSHVSRHPELFSSRERTAFLREPRPNDLAVLRRMMLHMDPPEHSKLRKIVNRAFTPQVIRAQLQSLIEQHAVAVVDAICERGQIDFLTDVAAEMPLLVLADILGAPREDRHLLYDWTNRLVGLDDPDYGGDPQAYVSAFMEMFAYARKQTENKRANPTDDLWSTIANAEVDGDQLSAGDLDRFFQLLMIAGNETTRNLIAGGLLLLDQNPDQLALLRSDLSLLPGAIEEMLRCTSPVLQFRRTAIQDTVLAGQPIKPGDKILIVYASANRDETVFTDPEKFDITRDPNPHISFGDGTHFCLGANLARLEARVLFTELFTRLPDIRLSGPIERMRSSFIHGFKSMPASFTPSPARTAPAPVAIAPSARPAAAILCPAVDAPPAAPRHGTPLLVLYGSNFGTAEDVAVNLARDADLRGFAATVGTLDEYVDALPRDGAVVITTSTYNGTPPDNARAFHDWISTTTTPQTAVRFAVFGCGDRDWEATFQDYPRLIDTRLAELGATRLLTRGEGDASDDFDAQLEAWRRPVWPTLAAAFGIEIAEPADANPALYHLEMVPAHRLSPFVDSLGAHPVRLKLNRELLTETIEGLPHRSVRHIEVELPAGVNYEAGDHLGVIPHNSAVQVQRAMNRFGLAPETMVKLHLNTDAKTFLPTNEPLSVRQLLADYVELAGVATRRDIAAMLRHTEYPLTRTKLEALLAVDGEHYRAEVLAKRKSVLDLLEEHSPCDLPFNLYLEMLPALSPRYYSISSSPRVSPDACSVTVGVLTAPARSGRGTFEGVCSNYLDQRQPDDVVYGFVRSTGSAFRLPADPTTPLIMIGAGTGIAPFRGFLQERAALVASGSLIGPALLLFGCRHPRQDQLYADELREFDRAGVTRLACAYSRLPNEPRLYVQDRLAEVQDEVWQLLSGKASIYVCGASSMAEEVRGAFAAIYKSRTGADEDTAAKWLRELDADRRYLVDVWASE
jgi:cytochrome P450/NADPH-cytochrome P450 reductase